MYRLIFRIVWTVSFIGFGYSVSYPETTQRLIRHYIEMRLQPGGYMSMIAPGADVEIARKAVAFFEQQCVDPAQQARASDFRFEEDFFEDVEPGIRPTIHPALKRSSFSLRDDLRYAPIETGAAIQSNPNLQ